MNQTCGDRCKPLWCVINSYEQIHQLEKYLRILIANGANPNIGRYPPLTLAAQSSYTSCMQILLESGASVNAVDPEFRTTLSKAGYMESTRMICMHRIIKPRSIYRQKSQMTILEYVIMKH